MFFFCFFCFFQATILQLPRIFVKDDAQAADAAGGAAAAAGARPAKPVAARLELEGEKRLPEGASWRFGEPGDEACRMGGTGWYRQVTITEKEGGVERKTNLTLPSYVWVGGETAKWPQAAEGETVAAFLCLFGMSDPPQRKSYFLLRVCFLWEGEYTGREVWQKLHRGGDIHQVGGYDPPPSVGEFFVGRSDMGPKWTCATLASWEVETPTPLILGRPTWPLLPSGLPSPPW